MGKTATRIRVADDAPAPTTTNLLLPTDCAHSTCLPRAPTVRQPTAIFRTAAPAGVERSRVRQHDGAHRTVPPLSDTASLDLSGLQGRLTAGPRRTGSTASVCLIQLSSATLRQERTADALRVGASVIDPKAHDPHDQLPDVSPPPRSISPPSSLRPPWVICNHGGDETGSHSAAVTLARDERYERGGTGGLLPGGGRVLFPLDAVVTHECPKAECEDRSRLRVDGAGLDLICATPASTSDAMSTCAVQFDLKP